MRYLGRINREIHLLGTGLELHTGQKVKVERAINQPDYQSKRLWFASPLHSPEFSGFGPEDSILVTLGEDFRLV